MLENVCYVIIRNHHFNILKQKIHNYSNILYIGSETYVIILDMAI